MNLLPPAALLCALAFTAGAEPLQIRVATFNTLLTRDTQGLLATQLNTAGNNHAKRIAEIVQRVRPDIVLINEFDYDAANPALSLDRFHANYLGISQNGQAALSYPYRYAAPTNTGEPTGLDLDNNGSVGGAIGTDEYGNDCYGFGEFPGKYGLAVYSKYPIQTTAIRTFRMLRWQDMPGNAVPPGFYSAGELAVLRLSSKNHVDLPIEVRPGHVLHLLASHPTPPVFDTAEDRNGRRNHDEIRLWADYISGAAWLYDDAGATGGLAGGQRFIVLGDMNADPLDGDSYQGAINQLRNHALVNAAPNPASVGGPVKAAQQGGVNTTQLGDPAFDTTDFNDFTGGAGNLRIDHVLPSKAGFAVTDSGVFWPLDSDPAASPIYRTATQATQTSDHRLVWLDLTVLPLLSEAVRDFTQTKQGSDIVLTWGTQPGVSYKVESSPDLAAWSDTPAIPVSVNAQTATATDAGGAAGTKKYYRIAATLDAP